MKSFASSALKSQVSDLFTAAIHEPVEITKHGKAAFVLMSEERYRQLEALEDAAWGARAMEILRKGDFVGADKGMALLEGMLIEKAI